MSSTEMHVLDKKTFCAIRAVKPCCTGQKKTSRTVRDVSSDSWFVKENHTPSFCSSVALSVTPICCATTSPSLKNRILGMARTL